jgi:hypothetical protein
MAAASVPKGSLRLEQAESSRLVWALIISLLCHGLVSGVYYTGEWLHAWDPDHWPAWLRKSKLMAVLVPKPPPPPPQPQEVPLMFVDVSPAQATPEPPKDAKAYSDKNSQAANPEAKQETDIPKITGTQKEVVKTEDIPREKFTPLQPSLPAQPTQEPQEELKARPALEPGDLTLAKPNPNPDPTPKPDEGEAPRSRPRTLREAMARQQDRRLPSQKMNQEGGVKRHLEIASLDAKATPFGAYDAALVEAISQCWFNLLEAQGYAADYRGKVVLQFQLHQNGRITDLSIAANTAGKVAGLICQTAIDKPNPYPPFPSDMRRVVGETRNIQFTFYYN